MLPHPTSNRKQKNRPRSRAALSSMSGVEEGGGEPSSGSTPDKKTPTALAIGAFMALINMACFRLALYRTSSFDAWDYSHLKMKNK
jgi:hypothetical protein